MKLGKTGILTALIDKAMQKEELPREYIGASSIGEPCERKLWYRINKYEGIPDTPRIKRTLKIGKKLEAVIIECLKEAGVHVFRGKCLEVKDSEFSLFQGNMDALISSDNYKIYILEIKTARDSSFNIFKKKGLFAWNPIYYAQIQSYMGMSGKDKAYIIVLNKDTSETWDELVEFDEIYYSGLRQKAKTLSMMTAPPARINEDRMFYLCKTCKFRNVCHDVPRETSE